MTAILALVAIVSLLTALACLLVAVRRGDERDEALAALGDSLIREDAAIVALNDAKGRLSRRKYPDSRLANAARSVAP